MTIAIQPLEATRLIDALRGEDPAPEELVARAAHLFPDDEDKSVAMRTAARANQRVALQAFLDMGFDPMIDDGLVLFISADCGSYECLEVLLDHGMNVMIMGGEAVVCAANAGHHRCLELLLRRGVDSEHRCLTAALTAALAAGQIHIAKLIHEFSPRALTRAWLEAGYQATVPTGPRSVEALAWLKEQGAPDVLFSELLASKCAGGHDHPVIAWLAAQPVDFSFERYRALISAARSQDQQSVTLILDAMIEQGCLAPTVLDDLREQGLEDLARTVDLQALAAGINLAPESELSGLQ